MTINNCEFTVFLEQKFVNDSSKNNDASVDGRDVVAFNPHTFNIIKNLIVHFVERKKNFFETLLTQKIFKLPNTFGSKIPKICEVPWCKTYFFQILIYHESLIS